MEPISRSVDELNGLSRGILASAISVHKEMGPGLLESVYQLCMIKELSSRRIKVECNMPLDLYYKGELLKKVFYVDLVIEDSIILELKAIEGILPVHEAQILSYLKLSNLRLGFIVNFNVPLVKHGFRRFVNNL